jgi:phenylacetate-CoA ligase
VFETGIRQFRLATAMVSGRRLSPAVLTGLIDDAVHTLAEFGAPGSDVAQLVDGPFADPAVRRDFADRALRRTARRLASRSAFYAERFAAAGVDPGRVDADRIRRIPPTVKADLVSRRRDFACSDSAVAMSTRTTGSTGRPAEIWMSGYEAAVWPALAALSGLLRDEIRPSDHMLVCISSRATAAVQQNIAVCRLVGAAVTALGVVGPDEALAALTASPGPTLLATYPSYLARLVIAAERRGLGPADFRLRRVDVGGEVLSPALAAAARATLGAPLVNDTFAITEVLPVSGRTCGHGHLHLDLNTGLTEVLSLDTGEPAQPGELGTLVITPYHPYRECMPVFRYDTRDLVRAIPDSALGCELAAVPATSSVLGKAADLVTGGPGTPPITTRTIVDALESLPTRPWPARFRAERVAGRLVLTVPVETVDGLGVGAARAHLADRGLPVELRPVRIDDPATLRRVRADLLETTFAQTSPFSLVGA